MDTIVEVLSVKREQNGSLMVQAIINSGDDKESLISYALYEGDPNGIAPLLNQWVIDNSPEILPYVPLESVPELVILPAVTLWERMSEDEAVQVEAAMSTKPFRTRQIFMTAQTFRSDHELWPLLHQMAVELFGEDRAAEILTSDL